LILLEIYLFLMMEKLKKYHLTQVLETHQAQLLPEQEIGVKLMELEMKQNLEAQGE
jgi:hypothetical protein